MIIKDYKGRAYSILEIRPDVTILECCKTKARITVGNWGWSELEEKL